MFEMKLFSSSRLKKSKPMDVKTAELCMKYQPVTQALACNMFVLYSVYAENFFRHPRQL